MQIDKRDLQVALEKVKPGLSNRNLIEQSTSFAFIDNRVVTFNDEVSVSHPIPGLNLTGAVVAEELHKILHKIKKNEIELTVSDKEIMLQSGKSNVWLTLQTKIKLPINSIGKVGKWHDLDPNFIKAIKFVAPACGKNLSKPLLSCVHISNQGFVEASDDHRIVKHFVKDVPFTFLLPAAQVNNVANIDPIQVATGAGWVHFKSAEDTIISCRVLSDDNYPDSTRFFAVTGKQVTLPSTTPEILDRALVFDQALLTIYLGDKKFKVNSKSDTGRFEEEAPIRYTDTPFSFKINPKILRDIVSETLDCTLSEKIIKFQSDNWQYVTSLAVL